MEGVCMPVLKVEQRSRDDCLTVHVDGELDSSSAAVLRTALAALDGDDPVIVDLRAVPFMDSAGLGALIGGIRRLRAGGTAVAICARPGAVRRLLTVTGFDRIIPTFGSMDEARVGFGADLACADIAPV